MSVDGSYGFVYCGAAGLGIGAFIIADGNVRGVDYGGLSYAGTAQENADGSITLSVKFRVPAGAALVQGVTPQEIPYDKEIKQTFPPLFGDGEPVETSTPPVKVMIRKISGDNGLLSALRLI